MPLRDLPDAYLAWLQTIDLRSPLATEVAREGYRRAHLAPRGIHREFDVSIAEDLIAAGVKQLARRYHPDAGGDHETMVAVQRTADELRSLARRIAA